MRRKPDALRTFVTHMGGEGWLMGATLTDIPIDDVPALGQRVGRGRFVFREVFCLWGRMDEADNFPEFIGLPAREGYLAELNGMAGNKVSPALAATVAAIAIIAAANAAREIRFVIQKNP